MKPRAVKPKPAWKPDTMTGRSRSVTSNQHGIHQNLDTIVKKHLTTDYQAPIADHSRIAFDEAMTALTAHGDPVILDTGCGTGYSTRALAEQYKDHFVIGVDRSAARLGKNEAPCPENMLLIRAEAGDLFRLGAAAKLRLARHYILYPNPYPKAAQVRRRWHGSPVFPYLLQLGGKLDLRSNWAIYVHEFAAALRHCDIASAICEFDPGPTPLTLFEKKYHESGQTLWRLTADLGNLPAKC